MSTAINSVESFIRGAIAPLPAADPGSWSLFNLLLTIAGIIIAVALLVLYLILCLVNRKNSKAAQQLQCTIATPQETPSFDDKCVKRLWPRIVSAILAIGAIALFLLTQNIRASMVFSDQWAIWHVIIIAVLGLFAFISSFKVKSKE